MNAGSRRAPPDLSWRHVAVALYVGVNLGLILYSIGRSGERLDWHFFADVDPARPYDTPGFVWSPVLAWFMAGVLAVGYWPWFVAHFAVLGLLRDWRLLALTGISWMVWVDAIAGNTFVFVFVAAVLAWNGSRYGTWSYLVLCLLMPRPVQLPLLIWILWKRPEYRLGFAALAAAHFGLVLVLGFAGPWLGNLETPASAFNVGPTALLGYGWLVLGVPLGAWLTWKGYVGWAGLAVSPYLLPAYWLMALLPPRERKDAAAHEGAMPGA